MSDTTSLWRGFKFTVVKRRGVPVGLEADCRIAQHKCGTRCTRTRAYAAWGGPAMVERRLKRWCLQGHGSTVETCAAHQDLPDFEADDVPSLEELERTILTEKEFSGLGMKRRAPT